MKDRETIKKEKDVVKKEKDVVKKEKDAIKKENASKNEHETIEQQRPPLKMSLESQICR